MGITIYEIKLLESVIKNYKPESVLELGSQNLYDKPNDKPPFAKRWYIDNGLDYHCIDLNGDNGAEKLDLSKELPFTEKYDIVTDFGTSEHIVTASEFDTVAFHEGHINSVYPKDADPKNMEGFYNCWLNKFNFLKVGGLMINVNPKSGNWGGHGYYYYTKEFYRALCEVAGLKLILLDENAAMGNTTDGWNIVCILQKENEDFCTQTVFESLGIKYI